MNSPRKASLPVWVRPRQRLIGNISLGIAAVAMAICFYRLVIPLAMLLFGNALLTDILVVLMTLIFSVPYWLAIVADSSDKTEDINVYPICATAILGYLVTTIYTSAIICPCCACSRASYGTIFFLTTINCISLIALKFKSWSTITNIDRYFFSRK